MKDKLIAAAQQLMNGKNPINFTPGHMRQRERICIALQRRYNIVHTLTGFAPRPSDIWIYGKQISGKQMLVKVMGSDDRETTELFVQEWLDNEFDAEWMVTSSWHLTEAGEKGRMIHADNIS